MSFRVGADHLVGVNSVAGLGGGARGLEVTGGGRQTRKQSLWRVVGKEQSNTTVCQAPNIQTRSLTATFLTINMTFAREESVCDLPSEECIFLTLH